MDAGNGSPGYDDSLRGGPVPLTRPTLTRPPLNRPTLTRPTQNRPTQNRPVPPGAPSPAEGQRGSTAAPPGGQSLPEFVIAPAHPDDGGAEIVFEVRQTVIGTDVLPVFSSVRHLVDALGPAQPWVALPLHTVREMAAAGGIREVVLDPAIQPGAWHWQYSDLEALEQSLES